MSTEPGNGPTSSSESNSAQSDLTPLYSNGRSAVTSAQKTIKLLALGVVSCAIPVIFFIQANELKRSQTAKDSTEATLQISKDTSILYARIKAYETYISQLKKLSLETFKDDSNSKLDSVISALKEIKSSRTSNQRSNVNSRPASNKTFVPTDSNGIRSNKLLEAIIRKQDSLAKNQDINIKMLVGLIENFRSDLRNQKPNLVVLTDSLKYRERMRDLERLLSDLRIVARDEYQESKISGRQEALINRNLLIKVRAIIENSKQLQ